MLKTLQTAEIVKKAKIPKLEVLICEAVEDAQGGENFSKVFGNTDSNNF